MQNASYGWIYERQPAARRVIDYIAGNVAQLGLKLYERVDDDDRRQVGDHPAAQALRRPNPQTPGKKFIKGFVKDFLTYENAYALKFRSRSDLPLSLVPLPPSMVGIVGRSKFSVDAYRVYRADGTYFDVVPEDMVHWRGESGDDPRRGESKLETMREELSSDAAARQAVTELHRSGLTLPGWIQRPLDAPEWSEEARKRFEEDWANRAKAGKRKSPVLEEGMTYQQGGVTPEDAELLSSRRFAMEYAASLYGMKNIPPETQEERTQFYTDVLPEITGQFADFLGLQVLEAEYGLDDYYFEFNLDEKLMGPDRLKAITSAVGAPPVTRNEGRAMLNLPAVKGGDEPITPLNVIVGDNPKPSPAVMGPQNPNGPPQDGSYRSGEAQKPVAAGSQALLNGETKALILPRRAAAERRHREYASEVTAVLKRFIERQRQTVKSNSWDVKAIEHERYTKELSTDLLRVIRRVVEREGGIQAARFGLADIDMTQVQNYLRKVSDEKAKDIATALQGALAGAEKPAEVFTEAKDIAAPRAAAGIATAMAAFAVRTAAEQTPDADVRTKTWVVTSGNSAHPELDGETVPLGATFSNGTDGPPADHPGCACLLECS